MVAHPPCQRWGRYWYGGPMLHKLGRRKKRGDDGGCFSAAVKSVREFGGVLEHPEASSAWPAHGILPPYRDGGWIPADNKGWTCCVEQGHYGHRARKATWLYYVGPKPPDLIWGKSSATAKFEASCPQGATTDEKKARRQRVISRLARWEREATPIPFRDLLIRLAENSGYAQFMGLEKTNG